MSRPLIRFFAAALVAVSGLALTAVTFDAEAARVGKGGNAGRQSSNVTNQNTAQPSAATSSTSQRSATAPAAAGAATAGAAAKFRRLLSGLGCGAPAAGAAATSLTGTRTFEADPGLGMLVHL